MKVIARRWLTAALSATALLAAGCGPASNGHQPAASASSQANPSASATGSVPAPSRRPSSSPAAPLCTGQAAGGISSATGIPGPVPPLDAVEFVSARQGWAAGAGRILATSDGGATWTRQYSGPAGLDQVDFINASDGWAVGAGVVLGTTDGGATWTERNDPCGSIRSVHFVSPDLGYAVAGGSQVRIDGGVPAPVNGGELLWTTDGGRSWQPVTGAPARVQTACFSSPADGFAGTPGKVWHTGDGGAHWSLVFTEPAAAGGTKNAMADTTVLECAGNRAAWVLFLGFGAALSHAPYLAYATQDAHHVRVLFEESYIESAERPGVHAPSGPGSYPGPFSAISPDAAAFVGWNPPVGYGAAPLVIATGGGSILTGHGNVGGLTQAFGVAFISTSQGWVVGTDQTRPGQPGDYAIEVTADGGRSWTRQYQVG